ncbi:phosphohistidine phosphatase [marine bacterium AO1-C]|nr:phosphohistidine phosphatase [marine bacterium AO1-C]
MKTLILLRHAKSSWKDMSLADFDRPLNKRGKRDAPFMAQRFQEEGGNPDLILASPALRTKLTAEEFRQALGPTWTGKLEYQSEIYEAHYHTLLELIKLQSDDVQTLLLVGHNPGLTSLTNFFSSAYIENVPTTGIVGFELNIDQWRHLSAELASLIFFDFPKNYFPKQGS